MATLDRPVLVSALLPALISLVCVAPPLLLSMTLGGLNAQAQHTLSVFWVAPIALGAIRRLRPTIRLSVLWPMALGAAFGFRLGLGDQEGQPLQTPDFFFFALGTTWLTWVVITNRVPRLTALLQSKPFVLVGPMSYSIYLCVARKRGRDHSHSPFLHVRAACLAEVCCIDGRWLDTGRAGLVGRGTPASTYESGLPSVRKNRS